MHKKFEINQTKIKGGCQLGRKVVPHNSKSDLPLTTKLFCLFQNQETPQEVWLFYLTIQQNWNVFRNNVVIGKDYGNVGFEVDPKSWRVLRGTRKIAWQNHKKRNIKTNKPRAYCGYLNVLHFAGLFEFFCWYVFNSDELNFNGLYCFWSPYNAYCKR